MACGMCTNAHVDPALTSDNDLSYIGIGELCDGYRIMFRSGDAKPTALEFEERGRNGCWHLLGSYEPKFCPNCGRRLTENEKEDRP